MKRILIFMLTLLILYSFAFAGRKSSDKVTDANSWLNSYIQDVLGNKSDSTNDSMVSLLANITNVNTLSTNQLAYLNMVLAIATNNLDYLTNTTTQIVAETILATNSLEYLTNTTMQILAETIIATNNLDTLTNSARVVEGLQVVPTLDDSVNVVMRDVIGNKTDTHEGTSIISYLDILKDFFFINQDVYRTNVDPQVVTNGDPWVDGVLVPIVPSNGITDQFTVTGISIETILSNDIYQLSLYYGPSDIECGKVRFVGSTVLTNGRVLPMSTILFNSNEIIKASLASSEGLTNHVIGFSLLYHRH